MWGLAEMTVRLFVDRSVIHGQGVFTAEGVCRGAPVLKCTGRIVSLSEIKDGIRAMQIGPDKYLVEDHQYPSLDDFLNHSCTPNLGFLRGDLTLYALRDIEEGEELSFDYSATMNERGWSMKCRCGSEKCRTQIRSYGDLFEHERIELRQVALGYLRDGRAPERSVANGVTRVTKQHAST
jgi:SET domain-containing protein